MTDLDKDKSSGNVEIGRLRDIVNRIKKEKPTAKETFELVRGVILHPPTLNGMTDEKVEELIDEGENLAEILVEHGWEDLAKSVRDAIKNIK